MSRLFSLIFFLFLSQVLLAQTPLSIEAERVKFDSAVDYLRANISPNAAIDTALISSVNRWAIENGNHNDQLRITIIHAQQAASAGNKRDALKLLNKLISDTLANEDIRFNTLVMLRDVYFSLDAFDKAIQIHKQIDWSVSPGFHQSNAQESFLAFVHAKIGDYERAAELLRSSIGKMRDGGFHYWEMSYTNSLGVIYEKLGMPDSAWAQYKSAVQLLEKYFSNNTEMSEQQYLYIFGLFTGNKAQILAKQGEHLQAIPLYKVDINASLADTSLNEPRQNGLSSLLWLTSSYLAIGQLNSAEATLKRVRTLLKPNDPVELRELYMQRQADFLHHAGKPDSAYLTLRALMQFRDSMRSQQTVLRTQDLILAYESILEGDLVIEEEIEALRQKTQRQRETNILFVVITIFTVLVAAAAITRFQSKTKQQQSILEKNQEIQKQKNLMEASLREKETLLREVNHRVKNNLQIISSLLFFQAKKLSDQHSKAIMQEAQLRIQTMSLIHQQLYQQQNFEQIDIKNHLQDLIQQIISSYQLENKLIKAHLDVRSFQIAVDKAVPLSLIVHELVSNSLKHAFNAGHEGNVFLTLRLENNLAILEYKDDGSGLAENFDQKNNETIGMKLINLLSQQLNAKFTIVSHVPFETQLSFSTA